MKTISAQELKEKLDRGDDFKLIMTMGEEAFKAMHIPGSISSTIHEVITIVQPNEEIVVYCSNLHCPASIAAYHLLVQNGYTNVRRFAGGLDDWQETGYPLEQGS